MTPLQELLTAFQGSRSSDLHLTPDIVPYIRRHGELIPMPDSRPYSAEEVQTMTLELVGKEHFTDFQRDRELDVAIEFNGDRLRVNLYLQRNRIAWSIRLLPSELIELDSLGIPLDVLHTVCRMQKDLVLITGATGAGKTTTLASIIHEINRIRHCHIVTIEDPVEYLHPNIRAFVSQREVGSDTNSFEEALRRILREDPDVVLIGEMRDQTTMRAGADAGGNGTSDVRHAPYVRGGPDDHADHRELPRKRIGTDQDAARGDLEPRHQPAACPLAGRKRPQSRRRDHDRDSGGQGYDP